MISDFKYIKLLLSVQYFVYFGTRGIALPYFNLFCHHLGFSGFEIGILSSVQTAAVVIFPVLWAMAADRFNVRKSIFIICTVMSTFLWSLLFLTKEFLPILFILVIYSVFYAPIIAFLEAFAMDILGREKKKYGKSRVWGTISFIGVSLVLGKLLSVYSTDIIVPLILAGMVIQSFFALKMPEDRKRESKSEDSKPVKSSSKSQSSSESLSSTESASLPESSSSSEVSTNKGQDFKAFFSLNTSLFLVAGFLMLASHGVYYGFFSIYLESLGFGTGFIGFAWALASIAEIAVMVNSGVIFSRFNLKTVLIISCLAACLRWILLFVTSDASPFIPDASIITNTTAPAIAPLFNTTLSIVILFSQLLHAFTYASFHIASILAIDALSPKGTTFGQAVNNAVTYGAGIMAGFLLGGVFYDTFQGYTFLASSVAALAGGIILLYIKFDSH
ncbi:MAG: MFS transporter [Desulfamplus sp.]|nr:MFS transporter [Desulfamplus sp.]